MIEPLPRAVRDYLIQFGLGCVYITSTREIGVTSPAGLSHVKAVAVWWARDRNTARQVLTAIGERRPTDIEGATAEVLAAANRIGATLSTHSVVVARAKAASDKIAARLEQAKAAGDLKFFNRAYHAYRMQCRDRGERAIPYATAFDRLRKVLARGAAGGSMADLVQRVFEG